MWFEFAKVEGVKILLVVKLPTFTAAKLNVFYNKHHHHYYNYYY